jgi:hypothetical protein
VARYFQEQPNAMGYFAQADVGSNVKAMQSVLNQGKTLGKAVYILSVDEHVGKVTHGNYLPPGLSSQGFDARSWASSVADIVGGKVRFLLSICDLPDLVSRLVANPILLRVLALTCRRLERQSKWPRRHLSRRPRSRHCAG